MSLIHYFIRISSDGIQLLPLGYITTILLLLVLFVTTNYCYSKPKSGFSIYQLTFCGVALALATITSLLKIYTFPFGGSITLISMLFITYVGYVYGPYVGIMTGVAYGILQFLIGPYIYYPLQVLVDYPFAFGALGMSGFFSKKKQGLIWGYLLGISGRFLFAFLSGWIFFGEYAWAGWGAISYSLVYNAAYIYGEGILTLLLLQIPSFKKGLHHIQSFYQSKTH